MKNKLVVKLLKKKTAHSLRVVTIILSISLITLLIVLSHSISQYYDINKGYIENNNVKVIHIEQYIENNLSNKVTIGDIEKIEKILQSNGLSSEAQPYVVYNLPNGTEIEKDNSLVYITGLNSNLSSLIEDNCSLDNNTICTSNPITDSSIRIKIPILDKVTATGEYISKELKVLDFNLQKISKQENSIFLNSVPYNRAYVNEEVFKKILEITYNLNQNHEDFNSVLDSHINKIIVYVNDIKYVDKVGKILKDKNYVTSYTFNSFDNFSANVTSSQLVALYLGLGIVATTLILSILFIINHLKIQKKEMAILKICGYTNSEVSSIYSRLIINIFTRALIISIFIVLCLYSINILSPQIEFILISLLVGIILYLTSFIIIYIIGIRKYAYLGILNLTKVNKEYE